MGMGGWLGKIRVTAGTRTPRHSSATPNDFQSPLLRGKYEFPAILRQKMLSALAPTGGYMGAMNDHDDMTLLRAWAETARKRRFAL